MGELMRIGEVRELTGIGENTLRRMADERTLATVRTPGGQRMYLRESVERWLERIRATAEAMKDRHRDQTAESRAVARRALERVGRCEIGEQMKV